MKSVDRYLRDVRIARARSWIPAGARVLDIGCLDGEMFRQLHGHIGPSVGIEPTLGDRVAESDYELLPGLFPAVVPQGRMFDVITMLAVLEHIPMEDQPRFADACATLLAPGGRIVITVPSPHVDAVLHVLLKLRLIDGISAHEHYGFEPAMTPRVFSAPRFRLIKRKRFQFGLNNLFVFERT